MKKIFSLLFFLSFFSLLKANNTHPYHVGSVEITYNEKNKTFEIFAKLFLDDLEKALKQKYGKPVSFHNQALREEIDVLLSSYFKENVKLTTNNSPLKITYLGFEEDRESVNIYLETEKIISPKRIEINNTLLYEYAKEQINIIHIVINNTRKSYQLEYPKDTISVDFL